MTADHVSLVCALLGVVLVTGRLRSFALAMALLGLGWMMVVDTPRFYLSSPPHRHPTRRCCRRNRKRLRDEHQPRPERFESATTTTTSASGLPEPPPTTPVVAAAATASPSSSTNPPPPPYVVVGRSTTAADHFTDEVVDDHAVLNRPGASSLSTGAEVMDRTRMPVSIAKRLYRVPAVPGQSTYRDSTGRNSSYAHLR